MIGAPVRAVPVLASGSLDLAAMAERAGGAGLFFVCNPNNPTGGVSPADAVKDFVARVRRAAPDAVLLMDEAYHDYVDDPGYATAMPLTRADRRIIVSRTFSKIYGMAGLRVGYASVTRTRSTRCAAWLSQGTLSNVSAAAALASLADREHHAPPAGAEPRGQGVHAQGLRSRRLQVLPSEANFLMVDIRRESAASPGPAAAPASPSPARFRRSDATRACRSGRWTRCGARWRSCCPSSPHRLRRGSSSRSGRDQRRSRRMRHRWAARGHPRPPPGVRRAACLLSPCAPGARRRRRDVPASGVNS